jgi:hypothetical protein
MTKVWTLLFVATVFALTFIKRKKREPNHALGDRPMPIEYVDYE